MINLDSCPVSDAKIRSMIDGVAICPTDRREVWCEGPAGFGHFAQNFFPEDAFETQPCVESTGRYTLVTDAYLDNRAELAEALGWSNEECRTRADSAFVHAAYERWGEECPRRLAGSFALAVWHPAERRLFAAVDQLGHRPFYFTLNARFFAFASTLRGLFALPEVSRRLNELAFAAYVARIDFPARTTLYHDVQMLSGGHRLSLQNGSVRITRYWNPDPERVLRLRSDAEYTEAFRAELTRAVRNSLQRYRGRAAVLLSGGLDSSAVTAVAGDLITREGGRLQAIHRVRSSPNRYAQSGRVLDESDYVSAFSAAARHVDFHFLPANPTIAPLSAWDDYFENNLVPFRTLPAGDDPEYSELLDRLDIGLTLNGLGGNYLVSLESGPLGYLAYLASRGRLVTWCREAIGQHRVYARPWRTLMRQDTLGHLRRSAFARSLQAPLSPWLDLLDPDLRTRTGIDELTQAYHASWNAQRLAPRRFLHRLLTETAIQQTGTAPSVVGNTRASRRSAAPLMDVQLNEFCLSLPFEQQIRDGWDRRLVRETMRGHLPDRVRLRVSRGQPQPDFQLRFAAQRNELEEMIQQLSRESSLAGYLDRTWLTRQKSPSKTNSSWQEELLLTGSAALARFVAWHSSWCGRRASPK